MRNKEEVNLKLLELSFERYLSRAHTTFEVGASIIPTFILGVVGSFFALQQANMVLFNKYYVLNFSIPTMILSAIIATIMLFIIFDSRKHRNNICKEFKAIRDNKSS